MKRIGKKTRIVSRLPQNYLMEVTGKGKMRELKNISKYKVDSIPAGAVKVGAIFDKEVELVGYELIKGSKTPKPGDRVEFTLYFKALKNNISKDFTVFSHNEGDLRKKRTKSDLDMAKGEFPTTYWKKGDIVKHPLSVRIPGNNPNSYYTIFTGLYQEEYRANITNHSDVPNDGDNRVILIKLPLEK